MKRFMMSFASRYLALAIAYLFVVVPSVPKFDNSRLYNNYPNMSLEEINKGIDQLYQNIRKAKPDEYFAHLNRAYELQKAFHKVDVFWKPWNKDSESLRMHNVLRIRIDSLSTKVYDGFVRMHTWETMKKVADKFYQDHPEKVGVLNSDNPAQHVEIGQLFLKLWHLWWASWPFMFLVVWMRCEQVGVSFWYELFKRPHKVIGVCLFPLALVGYPNDSLCQDLVRAAKQVWRFTRCIATTVLSWALSFGSFALTLGTANAQVSSEKTRQPITWMLDYRRTDRVGGNGPGGLPNTMAAQLENVPYLPNRVVLQSLSAFGRNGYQANEMVAVKTPVFKGLSIWPVMGLQVNTNRSVGVVYGTEVYYRRSRVSVSAPNIWMERVFAPQRKDTFWAIARPALRLTEKISLCGEVNIKKPFPAPAQTTLGIGGELKTKWARLKLVFLWKSTGEVFVRHQATAIGVL